MRLGEAARIARGQDWVISKYHEYARARSNNNEFLRAERDALQKIMTIPDRIREKSWSASGAGSCKRARQFVWLGFSQTLGDERIMNIFANGDYVHLRHQAFGMVAGYITQAEVSVSREDLNLKGTMDGLLTNRKILEIKSIHSSGFSRINTYGAKLEHIEQVHAYMLATGIDGAHIVYEDKNTNLLKEFEVHRDETIIDNIVLDLTELNEAMAEKKLLPMLPECKRMEGRYRSCPFASQCPDAKYPGQKRLTLRTSSSAGS